MALACFADAGKASHHWLGHADGGCAVDLDLPAWGTVAASGDGFSADPTLDMFWSDRGGGDCGLANGDGSGDGFAVFGAQSRAW